MSRSTDEQVAALRRELQAMQLRLDSVRARDMVPGRSAQVRLARISNTTELGDNTFEIVFLDGSYIQSPGMQSAMWTPRQNAARTVALNITGTRLTQGTVVLVFYWSQRWWIDRTVNQPGVEGGHVVTWLSSPRWWINNGPNTGTEDTTTGGYIWHPSPHNRSFRMAFDSMQFNGAGIVHNPHSYGGIGNIDIVIAGTYIFTLYLQIVGWKNSAGAASPPAPPETWNLQLRIEGSGGSEILGWESFSTADDDATTSSISWEPAMGTLYSQKQLTMAVSMVRTFTAGSIRVIAQRTDDSLAGVFHAEEHGALIYSAQLRIERLD